MITSRQNRSLKDMRRLRRSKGAWRDGWALLEGTHLIEEALDAGIELDAVLATRAYLESPDAEKLLPRLPRPPLEVFPDLLEDLADADSPRGLVATARLERGDVASLPADGDLYVFADGLQDPGNLGALARVAEAAGAAGLALGAGTVHPNHPRALRASAGSLLRLKTALGAAPEALESHLPGVPWAALATRDGEDLYAAALPHRLIWMVGAEGPGLSEELERRADLRLTIPLAPPVESLNATTAAAVALFEWRRRMAARSSRSDKLHHDLSTRAT